MRKLLFIVMLHAAMLRVAGIENGATLLVERDGAIQRVMLGGVAITDELHARELLRWAVGASWVLLEDDGRGAALVYRSPDALFVNRELVLRGYARATAPGIEPEHRLAVTYLGEVNPPATSPATAPRSGSGTSRRSPAPPSTRAPARRRRAPGAGRSSAPAGH
ncbi:MAG TPA: hypothetical protein VF824_14400 [Thermoanaerobaculia bacterium]